MHRFFYRNMRFRRRRSCSMPAGTSLHKPVLAAMALILPGDAVAAEDAATGVGADVTAKIDNPGDYNP
jgi:hypothetical protein